ncbi:MAG: hypothetical protein M3329_05245 [Pseudomonadota bacterium]|nr:hypothetical protein [Pseudomonadota bacterium]
MRVTPYTLDAVQLVHIDHLDARQPSIEPPHSRYIRLMQAIGERIVVDLAYP